MFNLQVVGARIIAIHRREDVGKAGTKMYSEEMSRIMPFLHGLDEKAAIFNHYPGVDQYAELFMASVHPDFRGQGLAGEMYRGAIRLLQAKGFKLLKSCFTSPFTQKVGEKMGFRELARARFKDHTDPDGGEPVFPDAKDHEIATIGVLEI
jgi:GNAT superfamily N-acetyltransferase